MALHLACVVIVSTAWRCDAQPTSACASIDQCWFSSILFRSARCNAESRLLPFSRCCFGTCRQVGVSVFLHRLGTTRRRSRFPVRASSANQNYPLPQLHFCLT